MSTIILRSLIFDSSKSLIFSVYLTMAERISIHFWSDLSDLSPIVSVYSSIAVLLPCSSTFDHFHSTVSLEWPSFQTWLSRQLCDFLLSSFHASSGEIVLSSFDWDWSHHFFPLASQLFSKVWALPWLQHLYPFWPALISQKHLSLTNFYRLASIVPPQNHR